MKPRDIWKVFQKNGGARCDRFGASRQAGVRTDLSVCCRARCGWGVTRSKLGDGVNSHVYSLMDVGNLQPGQTVLVQGTGGISIFAAQIALAHGARVIATPSSDRNLDRVKALGVSDGINYRTHPEWEKKVLELTGGKGADITIEVAGGNGLNQSVLVTKAAGIIAQVGFLTGQTTALPLMPLIFRQTTIRGIAVAPRSACDRMNPFFDKHNIKPFIDTVYPFDQAVQAYEHLSRGPFGKIVIKIAEK